MTSMISSMSCFLQLVCLIGIQTWAMPWIWVPASDSGTTLTAVASQGSSPDTHLPFPTAGRCSHPKCPQGPNTTHLSQPNRALPLHETFLPATTSFLRTAPLPHSPSTALRAAALPSCNGSSVAHLPLSPGRQIF